MSRPISQRSRLSQQQIGIDNKETGQPEQSVVVFKKLRKKDTFELLHNFVQRRKIKKTRNYVVLGLTLVLFGLSYSGVVVIQNNNLQELFASNNEDLEANAKFCQVFSFGNFDVISHPIAALLILLYAFLNKRRSLCKKCCFGRPTLPPVMSPFRKTRRFYTAFIYAIIAYEVFKIFKSVSEKSSAADDIGSAVNDPTGLFKFAIRILEVIIAALRYYPPLVAFCTENLVIFVTSTIYMWVDLANNVYVEGSCIGFENVDTDAEIASVVRTAQTSLIIRCFLFVPHFFCISSVVAILTTKTVLKIKKMITSRNRVVQVKEKDDRTETVAVDNHHRSKCLKNMLNRMYFSLYDLDYCRDLVNRNVAEEKNSEPKKKKKSFVRRFLYDWHPNFRFSSRVINIHLTALIALYYFFLTFLDSGLSFLIPKVNSNTSDFDAFFPLIEMLQLDIQFPTLEIFEEFIIGFTIPVILAFFICIIQAFLGLKSIQMNLLALYKGDGHGIPRKADITPHKVSIGNLKFAGFATAYLIWGFMFIFICLFLVSFIIIVMKQLVTGEDIKSFLLYLVPFIVVFIVKFFINLVMGRFVFLQKSPGIALDNYALYNVYVYVSFYLDCFVGIISAFVRVIKSLIGTIVFMPRIGYCVLGVYLAPFDGGHASYSSYLHHESTHSNPCMVTFCALLQAQSLAKMLEANESSSDPDSVQEYTADRRNLARNRWQVAYTLLKNPRFISEKKAALKQIKTA